MKLADHSAQIHRQVKIHLIRHSNFKTQIANVLTSVKKVCASAGPEMRRSSIFLISHFVATIIVSRFYSLTEYFHFYNLNAHVLF